MCQARHWLHTPLIPALGKQRQVNLYELEANLVYKEFQDSQDGYTEKQTNKQTNNQRVLYIKHWASQQPSSWSPCYRQ